MADHLLYFYIGCNYLIISASFLMIMAV